MDSRCEGPNMAYNIKYLWLSLNTSWALVFCIETHEYNFKIYWHK